MLVKIEKYFMETDSKSLSGYASNVMDLVSDMKSFEPDYPSIETLFNIQMLIRQLKDNKLVRNIE
jgi:hypothetical protein